MKKKLTYIVMFLLVFLTGCGHVKSAKKLISKAEKEHGACEVISKTETKEKTEVVLKDELQGFTYTVKSSMYDMNIDGASFGSLPDTRDNFQTALIDYALDSSEEDVTTLLNKYNATFKRDGMYLVVSNDDDGPKVCEEFAKILQNYNLKKRMDGVSIYVSNEKEHLGSCKLPNLSFRNPEQEKIDDYTKRAQNLMSSVSKDNSSLSFVKKETVPFSELKIPLSRGYGHYSENIEKEDDMVTLYYFKTNQQTFFIADFTDNDTGANYTNFDLSLEKKAMGDNGFLHFHFHLK